MLAGARIRGKMHLFRRPVGEGVWRMENGAAANVS